MAKNNEILYQALYSKECKDKKTAKKLAEKAGDCYTKIYYSLLAKYGGEPFSLEADKVFYSTTGVVFPTGSTRESILERLVSWQFVHKLD